MPPSLRNFKGSLVYFGLKKSKVVFCLRSLKGSSLSMDFPCFLYRITPSMVPNLCLPGACLCLGVHVCSNTLICCFSNQSP